MEDVIETTTKLFDAMRLLSPSTVEKISMLTNIPIRQLHYLNEGLNGLERFFRTISAGHLQALMESIDDCIINHTTFVNSRSLRS